MIGREYCRTHGGTKPVGPANHYYKHGRRSKYIPARLAEKYGESMDDPDLTEYRADIALLQSRLYELLETGESAPLWDKAQEAFKSYKAAERERDVPQMAHWLGQLETIINRGKVDSIRWADIYRVTEQIGKTKEREHKRLVQMQQMITAEQMLAVLGQIADVAKRTFSNPAEFAAFSAAIGQYGVVAIQRDAGGH